MQLHCASFLNYKPQPEFQELLREEMESELPVRVDMRRGFTSFVRALYPMDVYNSMNMDDASLIQKIRVACYRPETLKTNFGIDPNKFVAEEGAELDILDSAILNLNEKVKDPYFRGSGEKIGVVQIGGN